MPVTLNQKRQIKEEAGFQCAVPGCFNRSPLEIHHIIDQALGGTDDNGNLICLCSNCHGLYHNGTIPRISIQNYKRRVVRLSSSLMQHELKILEQLNQGQVIQLDSADVNLARNLERLGYVTINDIGNNLFEILLTNEGTAFIA